MVDERNATYSVPDPDKPAAAYSMRAPILAEYNYTFMVKYGMHVHVLTPTEIWSFIVACMILNDRTSSYKSISNLLYMSINSFKNSTWYNETCVYR